MKIPSRDRLRREQCIERLRAQRAEIKELRRQLEAVGAGGVNCETLTPQPASRPNDDEINMLAKQHGNTEPSGKSGGLGWKVRERRGNDGELLDCFVEAPAEAGMAYGLEVLGDDYTGYGNVEGKLKHCQMIVAWANGPPAAV